MTNLMTDPALILIWLRFSLAGLWNAERKQVPRSHHHYRPIIPPFAILIYALIIQLTNLLSLSLFAGMWRFAKTQIIFQPIRFGSDLRLETDCLTLGTPPLAICILGSYIPPMYPPYIQRSLNEPISCQKTNICRCHSNNAAKLTLLTKTQSQSQTWFISCFCVSVSVLVVVANKWNVPPNKKYKKNKKAK